MLERGLIRFASKLLLLTLVFTLVMIIVLTIGWRG